MTTPPRSEPRNPLYLLLLLVSLVFVLTVLAYVFVPLAEDKAIEKGVTPPPDDFRAALRHDGWKWLLVEVAAMIVVGIASMWLDRRRQRSLQNADGAATIAAVNPHSTSLVPPTASHAETRTTDRGTPQAD